ncbi:MAG: hypothetical protein Q7U38_12950, partial [Methylobacter sp.]|nr:hypothetical protein [Methylobacter sp.]
VAVSIGLRLFLMGFAPNVANPIKYTPTCPDTPLKTGKLQILMTCIIKVREAVDCHFEPADKPKTIRLHFVHEQVIAA